MVITLSERGHRARGDITSYLRIDSYSQLAQARKLPIVIDYLAQAEAPSQPIEVKAVLAFVALENLKHTFAHSNRITYAEGAFRKPSWQPGDKGKKYYFKDLVAMMLRAVGMAHSLDASYALRNDLIHSGFSGETYHRQFELYEDVHDLIREYLLRLLGYRGRYAPYSSTAGDVAEIK